MLKKIVLLLIILVASAAILNAGTAAYVNEDVEIKKTEICSNNVISVGGDVVVRGEVTESVNVIGGTLKVEGTVRKDVVCILTDIELSDSAVIEGDFIAIGGNITRSCKARIGGGIFTSRLLDYEKVENSLIPVFFESGNKVVKVTKIFFWFILALVFFALFPSKVYDASDKAAKKPFKLFATGIVSIILIFVMGIIFAALSLILIGIPFLLALIIFCFMVLLVGRTVVFHITGEKVVQLLKIDNRKINPIFMILAGAIVYLGVKFIPFVSLPVILIINVLEFGIGIRYLLGKRIKSL